MTAIIAHSTAADGTFSVDGAAAWNAGHTLTGTVDIANGGTGATTAAGARTALGLATVAATGAYADLSGTPTLPTGTVTSVAVSGGSTGLTVSGSPITTSGTITLAGTLAVANGGTALTATPANGQIPIGNGTGYTLATLTQGLGAVIVNAAGAVTVQGAAAVKRTASAIATGGSTALTLSGMGTGAATGTATARTPATTTKFTSMARVGYVSAASAGSSAGWRFGVAGVGVVRGDAAGIGGFDVKFRYGIATLPSGGRVFVGLHNASTVIGNVDPSTLTQIVGVGADAADTNLSVMHNDGSGTATKIDLGASFPGKTTALDIYDVWFGCAANAATIDYLVVNKVSGATASGSIASDMPTNTTFLQHHIWCNNGATAVAGALDLSFIWTETDV